MDLTCGMTKDDTYVLNLDAKLIICYYFDSLGTFCPLVCLFLF